jgi:hypothetical protein
MPNALLCFTIKVLSIPQILLLYKFKDWQLTNRSKNLVLVISVFFCFEVPNCVKKLNYSLEGKIVRHPTSIHLNYHEYGS